MSRITLARRVLLGVFSAAAAAGALAADKLGVVVSIPPQAFFVERVGGELVEVEVLVGPGQSPHAYEPTPQQMARLSQAKVYCRIGIGFENGLVGKIESLYPSLVVVDTRGGIALRDADQPCTDPSHHHEPGHSHGEKDPHIWLDPRLVKRQAETICAALTQLAPAHRQTFAKNLRAFQDELDALHARISQTLAPFRGREFFVYHPAFGYFADAYGLTQVAVEIEGKEPSAKQLADLIERARSRNVKMIFVQPQFSTRAAETLAKSIGGAVIPMDDLARDYLRNLDELTARIRQALETQRP